MQTDDLSQCQEIEEEILKLERKISPENKDLIQQWDQLVEKYKNEDYVFKVRDKEIRIKTHSESLSHTPIPKVTLPSFGKVSSISINASATLALIGAT